MDWARLRAGTNPAHNGLDGHTTSHLSFLISRYLVDGGCLGLWLWGLVFLCLFVVVPGILAFVGVVVALGSL